MLKTLIQKILSVPTLVYLGIVVAIGAVARLIGVTKASIWHDEGYTMMLLDHNFIDIIARTARDVHPPFYYLLTKGWHTIFGDSELAIRGFSVLIGLAIIVVGYLIMKKLFNEGVARLSALFLALGPFLVRYSDEARMYSLAALLVALASLFIIIAVQKNQNGKNAYKWWIAYGITIAATLYTQYIAGFIILVHIGYAVWQLGGLKQTLRHKGWWLGNGLGALLFVPWLPSLISQFTRVQSGFWIPPVSAHTVPDTTAQFLAFAGSSGQGLLSFLAFTLIVIATTFTVIKLKGHFKSSFGFLIAWISVPILLVLFISLKQPVYYDRYFTYVAIAFYMLLAAIIYFAPIKRWLKLSAALVLCLIFIAGIGSVINSAGHKMRVVGEYVSSHYQPGDKIISAELYTYFDFSYYNQTNQPVHLLSEGELSGYGETSLIYDKQDEIVVHSLNDIQSSDTKRVWLVGKVGEKDYYTTQLPSNWKLLHTTEAGDSAVRLYSL